MFSNFQFLNIIIFKFDDIQHKIIKIQDYYLSLKKCNILLILQRVFKKKIFLWILFYIFYFFHVKLLLTRLYHYYL